jgi:hypothetical protein
LRILAAPGADAALDPGGGNDGQAGLFERLAEHPLDRQGIPRLGDDLVDFHGLLPSLGRSSILPDWQRTGRSIRKPEAAFEPTTFRFRDGCSASH